MSINNLHFSFKEAHLLHATQITALLLPKFSTSCVRKRDYKKSWIVSMSLLSWLVEPMARIRDDLKVEERVILYS